MRPPLVIYHGNCADGFTAAWAVWKKFPDAEFFAATHQDPPPDVEGRTVIIVDFSYKRPVLDAMVGKAEILLVLDHHESAERELVGCTLLPEQFDPAMDYSTKSYGAHVLFDMGRSGAQIAWDFFHSAAKRPALVNYVGDRDLWKFALQGSRQINANIFSYPYDFATWDHLAERLEEPASRSMFIAEGDAIERKHHRDIGNLIPVVRRTMVIGGQTVPVANIPLTMTSDAGHLMSNGKPFAACYWDTPDGRVFSLRSNDDGLNVSLIAQGYGGGGHARAAGFRMPIGWEGDNPVVRETEETTT